MSLEKKQILSYNFVDFLKNINSFRMTFSDHLFWMFHSDTQKIANSDSKLQE